MKKDILIEIEVPQDIKIKLEGNSIEFEKQGIRLVREFRKIKIKLEGNKIVIDEKKSDKRKKKLINSFRAHINNIIRGMNSPYVYKLQICFVHFPTTVEIKGNELLVKNFLGETTPRKAIILDGVKVKKEDTFIIVESPDREAAGQTAANIEKATKIRNKDRRIFQDGVFLVEKPGRREF